MCKRHDTFIKFFWQYYSNLDIQFALYHYKGDKVQMRSLDKDVSHKNINNGYYCLKKSRVNYTLHPYTWNQISL